MQVFRIKILDLVFNSDIHYIRIKLASLLFDWILQKPYTGHSREDHKPNLINY